MISNINSYILNELQLENALEKIIMLRKVENRRECIKMSNRIRDFKTVLGNYYPGKKRWGW